MKDGLNVGLQPCRLCLGKAKLDERAGFALLLDLGGRRLRAGQEYMQLFDGFARTGAKLLVELDFPAAARRGVKDRTGRDGAAEHLFEAESLRAKLDVVALAAPLGPAFELDRIRDLRGSALPREELNNITLSNDAVMQRTYG